MKCEHCGKNEATVFFHSNINGKIEEQRLCPECAEKLGLTQRINAQRRSMMRGFQNFFGDSTSRFFGLSDGGRGADNANTGTWLDSFFTPMPSLMNGFFDNPFDDFFTDFPALGAACTQYAQEQQQSEADAEAVHPRENVNPNANAVNAANAGTDADAHTNAPENRFARTRRLNALRHEMKQAVKSENFERAAQIRDELRQIESQES